ncbi:hypothetical protein [Bradyrhizobium stylosanthis]|uniref:Uncharacterized protein n=1 Tax=Bradyrhizobium stylosanthis TaxID=1803665 RepID=A0A560CXH4_9BRAD|nr:hypothetical protein [Bradyrhizobium stylosanthis]TWA89564.1 hypothetical protein FBZ96_11932 [Bradyrhizobium stylosanthis]
MNTILETLERLHAFQNPPDPAELALAAIMAALYPNCEEGWNAWSRYAAEGLW